MLLRRAARARGSRLTPELREKIVAQQTLVAERVKAREAFAEPALELEVLTEDHLSFARKSKWREYFDSIGIAVVVALFIRAFVFEAFQIPTGSMEPTLLVGDYLFVSKMSFGIRVPFTTRYVARWGEIRHGDIVVFEFPIDEVQTQVNIGLITRRLEQHRRANGGYPGSLTELRDPSTGRSMGEAELVDGWGRPFVYELVDQGYTLRSSGRDGELGTSDDLSAENSAFFDGVGSCLDDDSLRVAKDYIKRVVGLPGDRVAIRDNILYVNDVPATRTEPRVIGQTMGLPVTEYTETNHVGLGYTVRAHGNHGSDFDEIVVRDGYFFTIGDNRDRSSDGRCWGQVPMENVKGRSMFIFFSRDRTGGTGVRWSRIFDAVR